MAAKKHTPRTTADRTAQGRQTNVAQDEVAAGESATQAERAPEEATEDRNVLTVKTTAADTPRAAEAAPIGPEQTPADECLKEKKLSALDAAARVLTESGQAMNCQELIAAMAAKGYWSSPHGKTPAGTLYSAILRELQTKKEHARFVKSQRGKFELRRKM
jgi:hypothetical protein